MRFRFFLSFFSLQGPGRCPPRLPGGPGQVDEVSSVSKLGLRQRRPCRRGGVDYPGEPGSVATSIYTRGWPVGPKHLIPNAS